MSVGYRAVQWSRYKIAYDLVVGGTVATYLGIFFYAAPALGIGGVDVQILRMRAFGSCAFLMVTVILAIGPLARLDPRFLPILYNRRHLGVSTAAVALLHAAAVLDWYHAHGAVSPLLSLLTSNLRYTSFQAFPFEVLGVAALVWLVVMAAISHDFWLAFLSAPVWKTIHMGVYAAYALLVMHVALGVIQSETTPILPVLLGASFALVAALHILADRPARGTHAAIGTAQWLDVGPPESIPDAAARIVSPAVGERIAVFRYDGRVSALSNVCAHQNGPLGEGRIVDGCVTCPWHGFQYRPGDGCAPPPFTEKLPTYRLRLTHGIVQVDPQPLPPGTPVEPLVIGDGS